MLDPDLRAKMRSLGIDARTWRAVAVLPLVEVAWADGRVQTAERRHILQLASRSGALEGDGRLVVEGWLTHAPSAGYFRRGREVLRGLQERLADEGTELGDILDACEAVAKAAGGLFGVFGSIEPVERNVLAEIADELPARGADWSGLMDQLEASAEEWQDDDPTQFFAAENEEAGEPTDPGPMAGAPALGGPHLIRLDRDPPEPLALTGTLRIGRGGDNDLILGMDARVSRRHCQLYEQEGRWYVVDASSVNGTRVDGEQVLERQLFGGELLTLGDTRLRFHR